MQLITLRYKQFSTNEVKNKFIFKDLKGDLKYKNNSISSEWLEWFIGFCEGDGSFAITNPQNKTNTQEILTFEIKLSSLDLEVLLHIQKTLKIGRVYIKKTYSIFRVKNLQELRYIIYIFNGNLILPYRKRQFATFLSIYNKKMRHWADSKTKRFFVEEISLRESYILPSLENAWLNGFTDAEGCFSACFRKDSNSAVITFNISQSKGENLEILKHFIKLFKVGNVGGNGSLTTQDQYYFLISGSQNCLKVYSYFEKYELKTIKRSSYILWKQLNDSVIRKEHLNPEKRVELIKITKQINFREKYSTATLAK